MIELLDLGKADVHLRLSGRAPCLDQRGQAMQRLWPEDHVDIRRALRDRSAFLTGDATTDADHETGLCEFQIAHAPEVREHFLLRLLAHRAGVEKDHVRVFRRVGLDHRVARGQRRLPQHVDHLVRVVLVHLATEGLDVELLHRGCSVFQNCHHDGLSTISSSASSQMRRTSPLRSSWTRAIELEGNAPRTSVAFDDV